MCEVSYAGITVTASHKISLGTTTTGAALVNVQTERLIGLQLQLQLQLQQTIAESRAVLQNGHAQFWQRPLIVGAARNGGTIGNAFELGSWAGELDRQLEHFTAWHQAGALNARLSTSRRLIDDRIIVERYLVPARPEYTHQLDISNVVCPQSP